MKFLRKFNEHTSYEAEVNVGGDFKIPNVSYCKDVKDVHFNPYNLIKFYVGNITGTTPQTVSIYTGKNTSIPIQVSKGNKWYSYLLPKDEGLYSITRKQQEFDDDIITKVIVKANISYYPPIDDLTFFTPFITESVVEASFKGSNTSKVTNMDSMFNNCSGLKSLDLSGWNTSNVTSMNQMFYYCNKLETLDLSGWDTSKVTNMRYMFYNCSGLKSLDLSNFNTSNVTNMNSMFNFCSGLASLDVSNFNTSKVTAMTQMFNFCSKLTSLDLSGWNTSNVTDMTSMFSKCSGLTSLDLSKWDISEGTVINSMFDGCSNSLTIRMVGCKQPTIDKIKAQLTADGISLDNVTFITK